MKKLLPILLMTVVFAAFITACAKQAIEPSPEAYVSPTIYITVTTGENPSEYKAIVSVANNPGIAGYNLALDFDNTMLTPVAVEEGDALKNGVVFSSNLMGATEDKIADMNAVTTVWAIPSDDTNDGTLYSVTFRSASSTSGRTELKLTSRGVGNAAEEPVDFVLQSAAIDFDSSIDNTGSWNWIIALVSSLLIATAFLWTIFKKVKQRKNRSNVILN